MKKTLISVLMLLAVSVVVCNADETDDPGLTAWVLAGDGVQEARIGYEGLLPDIEVALGIAHNDAPDGDVEEWPVRVYGLAHALDASMLASLLGAEAKLPDGNLYGGLFAEYTYDREDEFSGGYVIGGLVDWPKGWQTVVEYQSTIFNASDNDYELVLGLRRRF